MLERPHICFNFGVMKMERNHISLFAGAICRRGLTVVSSVFTLTATTTPMGV